MADPQPFWAWCPQPGAGRTTKVTFDSSAYGDGYVERATRGLNPIKPSWSLGFPFVGPYAFQQMDQFLRDNAVAGFWFTPPDAATPTYVTVDDWSATISDRNNLKGIVGVLNVTFVQNFNVQPYTPKDLLPPTPIQVTGNATVGIEAHERGIVKVGDGDSIVTFDAGLTPGTLIPWCRLGSGQMIFVAGGNGQTLVEMTGFDRAWQVNSAGTAWCVANDDGNTPMIALSGDLSGPTS
jgi:phage-related protein